MTLIVEDGTNVPDANSYADLAFIRAFALARGVTLSATDSVVEVMAINAMDYIEGKRSAYQGSKTYVDQALQWPRTGVLIDCAAWPDDAIPKELKNAQAQLCIEQLSSPDLSPSTDGFAIAMEKVDVIEVEYAAGGRMSQAEPVPEPTYPKVDAFLDPLIYVCGAPWPLRVRRI